MAAELAIIIGFAFMLGKLYQNSDSENARRMLDGPASLLVQELQRVPVAAREHACRNSPALQLSGQADQQPACRPGPGKQTELQQRQNLSGFRQQPALHPAAGRQAHAAARPAGCHPNSNDSGWITEDIEVLLLWIVFTGSTLGLLMYFYLRPMWRDLVSVRDAAELFANGDFHVRTPQAQPPVCPAVHRPQQHGRPAGTTAGNAPGHEPRCGA
jgi:hypothetical protein